MKLIKKYVPGKGLKKVIGKNKMGMKLTEFGVISLGKGETFEADNKANETALIPLGGVCKISGADFSFDKVGGRKDVFSGRPHTVYLPCRTKYRIEALSDVEIAWTESPSKLKSKPRLITPDEVKEVEIGKANSRRKAYIMVDEGVESQHFFIGEALVPSGNWASYPPHRHDFDNLPEEVDLEEVYFFRFDPPQGFGMQRIYTDNRGLEEAYTVENNDTVAIPEGYHPVVCAPGYTMYYLWIMTGKNRKFLSHKDDAHAWTANI